MLVRNRVPLDCSLPAERVLLALRREPFAFALTGRWAGGGTIVGCAPLRVLAAGEDPFEALEDLPPPPPRPVPLPDAHLAFYDHVLRRDEAGRWWFEALSGDPEAAGGER